MESHAESEKGMEKKENRKDLLSSLCSAMSSVFSRQLLTSEQDNIYQARILQANRNRQHEVDRTVPFTVNTLSQKPLEKKEKYTRILCA